MKMQVGMDTWAVASPPGHDGQNQCITGTNLKKTKQRILDGRYLIVDSKDDKRFIRSNTIDWY